MARWMTTEACYLHVDGTEWEHKETDAVSGRQLRKVYKVPLYIDKDREVCNGNNCQRGDIVFKGPPIPSMEPLDDEAEALSAKERARGEHPIESLSPNLATADQFAVPMPEPVLRRTMRRE